MTSRKPKQPRASPRTQASPKTRPTERTRTVRAEGGRRGGAPPAERLQKILARAGVASRRAAEDLIREGRVRVNGRVVSELGARADPSRARIEVDGRRIPVAPRRRSYVVYKPRGVVTTTRDPHAKRTVMDLVPERPGLFPVGRLDAASEGLLLLTNDGALGQVLLHPSFQVPRTYRVSIEGVLASEDARRLSAGIELRGRTTAPCEVAVLRREPGRSVLEITLIEGRRRQIREMLRAVGHPVRRLVRTRFGPVELGGLAPGESRPLRAGEQRALERLVQQAREGAGRTQDPV